MPNKSLEERAELQEQDDGSPDDTVLQLKSSNSRHYHEDPECRIVKTHDTETEERTRGELQERVYAPCPVCVL